MSEKVFNLLERTNLNWSVKKEPLFTNDGKNTESFGLFRNDNEQWLGTVGNRYQVYNNSKLATIIVNAAEGLVDTDLITGGSLGEGKKVFLQIPLEDKHIHTDTIKRNITALNSHDGSTSIGFGSSNTVVVCRNTFYQAHKELKKFRHTDSADQQIKKASEQLKQAILKDNKLMEDYSRMVDVTIDKSIFGSLVKKLFDVNLDVRQKDVSTRKKNTLVEFQRTVETKNKNASETKEHLMVGSGYRKNLIAFDEIMKFVNTKTSTKIFI